jgi:hypothetical protein
MATAPMKRRTSLGFADAHDSTPCWPPSTTEGKRKPDRNAGTCSNPRHEPQTVSRKPKRDGATHDRIVSRGAQRGTIRTEAELKVENH